MRKGHNKIYSRFQRVSSVCMILALIWLTVSLPFVYAAQQGIDKEELASSSNLPVPADEEETAPFSSGSDEKAPSTSSVSEEYLHDHHKSDYFFSIISRQHKCENADTYVAFHGELLVPPPNAA